MASMKSACIPFLLVLGCAPAMAQEAPKWIGAADCRLAPVTPPPAQAPAWKGGCRDGYADGKGVLEWTDAAGKRYKLEADVGAGRVRGDATLHYPNGELYTGTLKDGVPDGHGYFREPNGDQYEGEVRMGELTGMAEVLYVNGDDYKGEFKKGKRDGTGTMAFALGGRYEGGWKNGEPSGPGKIVYAGTAGREVAVQDGRDSNRALVAAPDGTYTVKQDIAAIGTTIRRDAARGVPVPPERGFKELTAQEQATVASWYPALAPGDEPPYPAKGPAEFLRAMQRVVSKTLAEGDVTIYVLVGADGKVRSVKAIGLNDPEARKIVATMAGLVQYKPAVCAGQPCEMVYPYRLALTLEP
ncbi:hypothetical protein [Massilia rhizosphaerae]|uniref:hypothetical protein n=1 Tax=Massilia rhizosphaerae TaxID=2784389 RepID=UPI0018DECAAC|nr:hypothetical protein [Massilia rhizosphaerae]